MCMLMKEILSTNWWTALQPQSDVDGDQQFCRNYVVGKFYSIVDVIGHGCFHASRRGAPLPDILSNPPGNARQYAGDPQLQAPQSDDQAVNRHGTINLLTANVATMEYGQDGIPFSHKMSAFDGHMSTGLL